MERYYRNLIVWRYVKRMMRQRSFRGLMPKELNRVEEVEDQLPKEKPVPGCHADHRVNRVSIHDPCPYRLGMAPR